MPPTKTQTRATMHDLSHNLAQAKRREDATVAATLGGAAVAVFAAQNGLLKYDSDEENGDGGGSDDDDDGKSDVEDRSDGEDDNDEDDDNDKEDENEGEEENDEEDDDDGEVDIDAAESSKQMLTKLKSIVKSKKIQDERGRERRNTWPPANIVRPSPGLPTPQSGPSHPSPAIPTAAQFQVNAVQRKTKVWTEKNLNKKNVCRFPNTSKNDILDVLNNSFNPLNLPFLDRGSRTQANNQPTPRAIGTLQDFGETPSIWSRNFMLYMSILVYF